MKKTGIIKALNVSPKGFYEGFLLGTSKGVIQVNLPKAEADILGKVLTAGARVTADVEAAETHGSPAHAVFNLVRWHGQDGKATGKNHKTRQFAGTVERLNYSLHGEANGGILDSGDFMHVKPKGARALGLKAGMNVEGHGRTKRMDGGHFVIRAAQVNGIAIAHHKTPIKHAGKQTPRS